MASSTLELTIVSAEDLKNVSTFGKMNLFVRAWVNPAMKVSTRVLQKAGRNPIWNDPITLCLENYSIFYPSSCLVIEIMCEASMGDKMVGSAQISLEDIYALSTGVDEPITLTLQLLRPSGRAQGIVRVSMMLKEQRFAEEYASQSDPDAFEESDVVPGFPVGASAFEGISLVQGIPVNSADASSSSSSGVDSDFYEDIPYAYPSASYQQQHYPTYSYQQGSPNYSSHHHSRYSQQSTSYNSSAYSNDGSSSLLLGLLGGAVGGFLLGDVLS